MSQLRGGALLRGFPSEMEVMAGDGISMNATGSAKEVMSKTEKFETAR